MQVDPYLAQDKGNFLVLDGRDLSVLYKIPPSKKRVRANRSKLRALLLQGLNVEVSAITRQVATAGLRKLISCKNHSTARSSSALSQWMEEFVPISRMEPAPRVLFSLERMATTRVYDTASSKTIPALQRSRPSIRSSSFAEPATTRLIVSLFAAIVTHGVVQRYTPEQVAPLRDLDPLLFQAIHPELGHFLCGSREPRPPRAVADPLCAEQGTPFKRSTRLASTSTFSP